MACIVIGHREPLSGFFLYKEKKTMDIYIYSDESGVFDYLHNDYFVFAGAIFFSKQDKDDMERKYVHAE